MSWPHALASLALISIACTRPTPPPGAPLSSTRAQTTKSSADGSTSADCDGALTFSIETYVLPHGGSQRLVFGPSGQLELTTHGGERDARCSASLSPADQRAIAQRVAALQLHMLPRSTRVPHVRDGIAIVVQGSCGTNSVDSTTRNIFPAAVGRLTDLVNGVLLSVHCSAGAPLPSSADLARWSDSSGATQTCARDCGACNTCSP